MFFTFFPELAFDSFLTIGAEDATTPAAQHPSSVWGENDAPVPNLWVAQAIIVVDDATGGAWYTPFPGTVDPDGHVAFAGEDLRVLLAQFTTAGIINGQFQVQVFVEGNQGNEFRDSLPLCTGDGECGGCTDEDAVNYDDEALYDDGSCIIGVNGCTDETACNYDSEATTTMTLVCTSQPANATATATCSTSAMCGGDGIAECGVTATCSTRRCVRWRRHREGALCDGNVLDECGVCGGEGIAEGACDCDGNVLDECGVCGGEGIADGL